MIDELHKIWNVTPEGLDTFTGYESVYDLLDQHTKESYEADKEGTINAVFEIYRSINIVPILYYTEEGLLKAIRALAHTKANDIKNNTLGLGNNQGQHINRFLFPNMMDACAEGGRKNNSLRDRFFDDKKLKRAIKICFEFRDGNKLARPSAMRRALDLVTGGNIQNFKSLHARSIADHLNPMMFGTVYDFSAGFGGRMLGIGTSNLHHEYIGTDPNTITFKHLTYLKELLAESLGHKITIHNSPSEDLILEPGSVDLAFSSPPYFNLEKYSDEPTQCMVRCSNLDMWFEEYAKPTIQNIHSSLENDGVFAVNIADYNVGQGRFEIVERWKELTVSLGFKYVKTIDMLLNSRPGVGNESKQKTEGIYVFKR